MGQGCFENNNNNLFKLWVTFEYNICKK